MSFFLRSRNNMVRRQKKTTPTAKWERPVSAQEQAEQAEAFRVEDQEILECVAWPMSTSVLCHNCCHSFDGVPVPLPESYDALKKVYYCRGNFCSWQCAKAYNMLQTPMAGRGNRNMHISLLAYRTWIKRRLDPVESSRLKTYALYNIQPSPSREKLRVFGGTMSIEEYRAGSFGIIPPDEAVMEKPFLTVRQRLLLPFIDNSECAAFQSTKSKMTSMQKIEESDIHKYTNAFCQKLNRARTDHTIMKRRRDDSRRSTLMSTMGVVIEKKNKVL